MTSQIKEHLTRSEPFAAAQEAMSAATELLEKAKRQAEQAKQDLIDAVRRFLLEAEGEAEVRERATYVYWEMPQVPVATIAEVMLGNPKAVSLVAPLLTAKESTIICPECGAACVVKSRSELTLRHSMYRDGIPWRCAECTGKSDQRWSQERLRQDQTQIERIQALRSMPYRDYLSTPEWLQTRNQALRRAAYRCQLCNVPGLLNVHHRTYERRGCEDRGDLIVLCHPCHAKFHNKLPA